MRILVGLVLVSMTNLAAQEVQPVEPGHQAKPQFWLNIGVGEGTVGGPAGGVSVSYQTGKHLISLRAIKEYERLVWNGDKAWEEYGDMDLPARQNWDLGLLYGRTAKTKYVLVSFSAGLGLAGGIRRGTYLAYRPRRGDVYEKRAVRTWGIATEVRLVKTILGRPRGWSFDLGFGLYGYGNLNPEASFAGLLLLVELGKLQ